MLRPRYFVLLVVMAFMLAGCAGTNGAAIAPATTQSEPPLETEPPEEVAAISTSNESTATEEAADATEEVDYCLECHTDQQSLIDTAKPEEEVPVENKGEG